MCFEDRGRGHGPKNSRNTDLEAKKVKEIDSFLAPLEEAQQWQHLDFDLVKLISDS